MIPPLPPRVEALHAHWKDLAKKLLIDYVAAINIP